MKDDRVPRKFLNAFRARLFLVHPAGMAEHTGEEFSAYTKAERDAVCAGIEETVRFHRKRLTG